MVVALLQIWTWIVVIIMVVYAFRHWRFTWNRISARQRPYYQDMIDSELPPVSAGGRKRTASAVEDGPYDAGVFRALRDLRKELADERDVPAYVVFSDAVLRAMARELPRTPAQLRAISGVGEKKLADFGARFLAAIAGARE